MYIFSVDKVVPLRYCLSDKLVYPYIKRYDFYTVNGSGKYHKWKK